MNQTWQQKPLRAINGLSNAVGHKVDMHFSNLTIKCPKRKVRKLYWLSCRSKCTWLQLFQSEPPPCPPADLGTDPKPSRTKEALETVSKTDYASHWSPDCLSTNAGHINHCWEQNLTGDSPLWSRSPSSSLHGDPQPYICLPVLGHTAPIPLAAGSLTLGPGC